MNSKRSAIFGMMAIAASVVLLAGSTVAANHPALAFSGTRPACLATSSCGVYYGPCVQEQAQFSYTMYVKFHH